MKALKLIIRREYLTRIKKKSFILLTILMPILISATIFLPLLFSEIKDSRTKRILVLDATSEYASHLVSTEDYFFEILDNENGISKPEVGKDVFGVLQITENLDIKPKAVTLLSKKQAPKDLVEYINHTLSEQIRKNKLENLSKSNNLPPQTIIDIETILKSKDDISVTTLRIDDDGVEKETSATIAATVGLAFTFLMYMFILMYGAMVMNGVVEEKSNRIVEVMISSVRPFDLMMGKIIGIGLTGLTQLLIWSVIGLLILGCSPFIAEERDLLQMNEFFVNASVFSSINWGEIFIFFIILFIGGYLIYASIFAMFGAAVDNAQDTQQFVMPITLVFIFALYAGIYSVQNPDGPLAFWCSMIPFTSPIVMMVRIPFHIPLWEKLLSLAILYITIYFIVRFAAKIYRIGILMYGKKPSLKEIFRWVSYK